MFLLASRCARDALRRRADLAGLVFAFSLWMVTWLSYPHMSVWALMPWMMLLTDRLVRRPDLLSGAGLAGVLGVEFLSGPSRVELPRDAGHRRVPRAPAGAGPPRPRRERRACAHACSRFGGAVVAGVALVALVIIPFAELLWHSADIRAPQGRLGGSAARAQAVRAGHLHARLLGPSHGHPDQVLRARPRDVRRGAPADARGRRPDLRPTLERIAVAAFGRALARRALRHPAVPADRDPAAGVLGRAQQPPHAFSCCPWPCSPAGAWTT